MRLAQDNGVMSVNKVLIFLNKLVSYCTDGSC
jgi:hypothetical protein